MKKLFITALFALLMGGFAITANAQDKVGQNAKSESGKFGQQTDKAATYQKMIDDFQSKVNTFEFNFNALKEGTATGKIDLAKDLQNATDARDKIEKDKEKMTDAQVKSYKEIVVKFNGVIEKYEKFLKKG